MGSSKSIKCQSMKIRMFERAISIFTNQPLKQCLPVGKAWRSFQYSQNHKTTILIFIAVFLGAGIFFCPGIFLLFTVFAGFLFFVNCKHKKRVLYVFLAAIILRIFFSFAHMLIGYGVGIGSDLLGDSVGYSGGGAYIAEITTNEKFEKFLIADELANLMRFRETYKGAFPKYEDWRVGGYTYYLGLIYSYFGFSPIAVKLINSFLFIIMIYIIYRYLVISFGEQIGFFFLVSSLFVPSLFAWSVSGLKDQLISFILIAGIFSLFYLMRLKKFWGAILAEGILTNSPFFIFLSAVPLFFKRSKGRPLKIIGYAVFIFLSKLGMNTIRPNIYGVFYFMLQCMIAVYLLIYFYQSRLFRISASFLMVFFLIIFSVKGLPFEVYKRFTYESIAKSRVSQVDAISRLQIYPERYNYDEEMKSKGIVKFNEPTIPEFIVMVMKGFGYAIFSPLLWLARSKPEFFASIEGCAMLVSFFWVARSLLFLCFRKAEFFLIFLPMIIPFFILVVLLAFFEGNIGTLFRHRSMMLPFYCALFAIGLGRGSIREEGVLESS